jgi:hypothetical protein
MNVIWLISNLVLWGLVLLLGFLLLGALRALALVRWRLAQLEATTPNRLGRSGLRPGRKAPEFTLPDISGGQVAIHNGDAEAVQRWTKEHQPHFPVALQERFNLSKRYEVFATPFAFLIDEREVIAARGIVSTKQYLSFVLTGAGQDEKEGDSEAESSGESQSLAADAAGQSRRGFLGRLGQAALGVAGAVGGLLLLPREARAYGYCEYICPNGKILLRECGCQPSITHGGMTCPLNYNGCPYT